MYASIKVCSKCGSVIYLSMHCKVVAPSMINPSMPALVDQNFSGFTQLSYLPNPYFQYGNINMPSMPCGTPHVNNSFSYQYLDDYSQSCSLK